MTYTPDNWVILKIDVPKGELHYRVLAGWSGGYLDGDSWRLNSGITRIEEDDSFFNFYGSSGSLYRCNKESEFLRQNCSHIYEHYVDKFPGMISLVTVDEVKEFLKNESV